MLNIRDLKIDVSSLGKTMLLVEVRPVKEYKDNKPTDVISGYRYVVCLPEHKLEKLSVKIDGKQLMDTPEDGVVEVRFSGLEVGAYVARDGSIAITAKATGIAPAVNNKT